MEVKNIEITDINTEGLGVGRGEDFEKVLFVKNAIIGEVVDAGIIKHGKNFAIAEVVKTVKPSIYRENPRCEHFGICGGCLLQHVSGEGQLLLKHKKVIDAITKIAKMDGVDVKEIIPSSTQFEYRNKMDFSFSELSWIKNEEDAKERRALGMHVFGRFDRVLNLKHCHLTSQKINEIRNFIYDFCISKNASFWNPKTKEGVMKGLIVKESSNGGILLIIIFGEQPRVLQADLCMAIKNNFPEVASIHWGVNKDKDANFLDEIKLHLFKGEEYTIQNLLELTLKVGVKSFAQVNNDIISKMIQKVLEVGNFKLEHTVYDLYSGIGTFSLHIAKYVKKVISIEVSGSSIDDARENAKDNEIENIKFIKSKVEDVLSQDFMLENGKPNVVLADPPRSGLEGKSLHKIIELEADKLIYISCNPATFARDAVTIGEKYKLEKVLPFDMFPQTSHVEIIAVFKKI
jgi:23S rRNA (uracil1939-C5)-methyltransferase